MKILLKLLSWLFSPSYQPVPAPIMPQDAPKVPNPMPVPPKTVNWSKPSEAYHATRVLCDEAGLTVDEKNLICACLYQESQFHNSAINRNKNAAGTVLSTDWGLAQVNDHYHIGPHKDFPTVDYVVQNPAEVIKWMISMYQHGLLKQWVSFSSGAYKKWLLPISPMWLL